MAEVCVRVLVALLLLSSLAFAGEITVVTVTPSSTWSTYDAVNLINGSGLVGGLHDGIFQHKWLSDENRIPAWLVFDLGSPQIVASTYIWNYGDGCCGPERSTKNVDISWSNDNLAYTPVGGFVLGQPVGLPFPADILSLGVTARYIKFDLLTTYAASAYIGLGEVKFYNDVPEPSAFWLAAAGIGTLVLRMRSRRG